MNARILSEALGELDIKYVEEALGYKKRRRARLWGAAAACAACAAVIMIAAGVFAGPEPAETGSPLPVLTVDANAFGGMGFEGYMAYDVSELVSANPWNEEMALETLPVYKSGLACDEFGRPRYGDEGEMRGRIIEIAARFGIPEDELEISSDAGGASAGARGINFSADIQLTVYAYFETPVELPEEYNFSHRESSYEDYLAVAAYMLSEYGGLLGMDEPRADVCGGDYNIYGEQGYRLAFYEGGESAEEEIIGFNFSRAEFYCDDAGRFSGVRFYDYDLSQKLGDYPVISSGEALELLCGGAYITTAPYEFPGRDSVKKVELIYRTSAWDEYLMPYYRFYAELPDAGGGGADAPGLKNYGAYYVPAVAGEYLDGLPLWGGEFN